MTIDEKRDLLKKLLKTQQQITFPVSFGQERLWFLNQMLPDSPAYNLRLAVRLLGKLNVAALEKSINQIVARHAILRTRFVVEDDRPKQFVVQELVLKLAVVSAETSSQLDQLADAEAQQPFDLVNGPLIRSNLLKKNNNEHILLITMHHSVSDGWSLGIFMQELATLYQANCLGQSCPLAPLPLQYADFAKWQREQFATSQLQAQLAYWRDQLQGHQPALDLPTDHPRPPLQTFNGLRHYFSIDAATTQALRRLQTGGVTEFMLLLAAFKLLLFRHSGQNDILVGSPIAGRTHNHLEPLIGLFINTLVFRSDLQGEMLFSELLQQVRQTALDAYSNQAVPFEKLVEAVQPVRDPSRNPLFQVLFTLQNAPQGSRQLPDLELALLQPQKGTSQFDLSLTLWQEGAAIAGYLEYNSDLYTTATIARMVGHYQNLLVEIGRDAAQPLNQISMLDSAERQQILYEWNATQRDYDLSQTFADRFEAQVAATPNRIAATCLGDSLTYAQLNARANAVAQRLQTLGVQPNQLIGLAADRSLEMLVGLLGILKSGAAYVPIDPDYPAERVQYMIEMAELHIVLTQSALQDRYTGALDFVLLDQLADQAIDRNPQRNNKPTDRAYIIFTSGSTGKPKGVQITQQALLNFLLAMRDQPGISAEDQLLAVTTISFDIAALELYLPLLVGARVVIASSAETVDSYLLAEMIDEYAITVMQATPATWRMLLAIGWQGRPTLKILSGGEALPQDLAAQLYTRGAELW
ncbi:MAG TPA: non-ribosomal peptide synthetase, partial [Anaerolineae bacterium]|nr:non-ribosomal peptide synthetase [Anaerolineae bacterium]